MKRSLLVACAAILCLTVSALNAQSVTIQYGTVKDSTTVTEKSRHAGGALAGGVLGAVIGPNRHRGLGTTLILATYDLGQLVGAPTAGAIVHFSGQV